MTEYLKTISAAEKEESLLEIIKLQKDLIDSLTETLDTFNGMKELRIMTKDA